MTRPPLFALLLWCAATSTAAGGPQAPSQNASADLLTIDQAIEYAAAHYPSIRAALEQANASAAGVGVARAAYLPRLDALWQSTRGTANNVFGQVLPQSVIPSLTGPVLPEASGGSVWGSATGALLSWEPFDFGLRHRTVAGAEAGVAQARAAQSLTRLSVQAGVAQSFLAKLAAQRAVRAAEADLDRRMVLARSVRALVDNQLRPGIDASRAEAERAAALTRLIQSQQTLNVADAVLARSIGRLDGPVGIAGERLLASLPSDGVDPAPPASHPLATVRQAAVAQARDSEAILARTDLPRIYLQSSLFARGSGASPNGTLDGGWAGLKLDRANWAVGVQVVLPNVFDLSALGARKAAAAAVERADTAAYEEALLAITSEQRAAAAMVQGARAIAANTPVQLAAARETEVRARARYESGLATVTEVADAQSLLAEAEVQNDFARIDVWRALLTAAAARGDLAPFLALVRQTQ
jgi:outer membrane protein